MRYFFLFIGSLALIITSCHHKEASHPITGFWKLNSFEVMDSSGSWKPYSWNEGGTGYLMYDGRGHAAIHITPKNYSEFRWKGKSGIDSMSLDELRTTLGMLSDNYNYMAKYEIDSVKHLVKHTRLSHSRPEDWGKTVERRYELLGKDTLLLFPIEGDQPRKLTWIREID